MLRRTFMAGLGGAAACPAVARVQQPIVPVVGCLDPGGRWEITGFLRGLSDASFVEGRNVVISVARSLAPLVEIG
jgi:putative ABC transport system substrate-binding protein